MPGWLRSIQPLHASMRRQVTMCSFMAALLEWQMKSRTLAG